MQRLTTQSTAPPAYPLITPISVPTAAPKMAANPAEKIDERMAYRSWLSSS